MFLHFSFFGHICFFYKAQKWLSNFQDVLGGWDTVTHINSETSYEDYGWNNNKPVNIRNKGELSISNLSSYRQSADKLREEYGHFRQSGDVKIQSKQSECSYDINFWNKTEKQLTFDYQQLRKDLGNQNLFTNDNGLTEYEIKEIINNYTPRGKALYYEKNN